MKSRLLVAILALLVHSQWTYGAFPTNTNTETVNIDNMAHEFDDFSWRMRGYEDQRATLTVTNDAGDIDMSTFFGLFKMNKRAAGTNINYITRNTDAVTMGTATMGIVITHETLEQIPDDTYQAEWLLVNPANTNDTRTVGRGTIRVEESLFDDDDGTFSASTITNLVDYLTIVSAAATYVELAGDTMTGDLLGGANNLTNWNYYGNAVGLTGIVATLYLPLAGGTMSGDIAMGGGTISDQGHVSGGTSIKQLNLWSGLSADRAYIELHEPGDSTSPGDVVVSAATGSDIFLNDDVYLASNDLWYVSIINGASDSAVFLFGGSTAAGVGQSATLFGGQGDSSNTAGTARVVGGAGFTGADGGNVEIRGGASTNTDGVVLIQDADENLKLQIDANGMTASDQLDMGGQLITGANGGGITNIGYVRLTAITNTTAAPTDDYIMKYDSALGYWNYEADAGAAGTTDMADMTNWAGATVDGDLPMGDNALTNVTYIWFSSDDGVIYTVQDGRILLDDAGGDNAFEISDVHRYYFDPAGGIVINIQTNTSTLNGDWAINGDFNMNTNSITNGFFVGDGSGLTNITSASTNVTKSGITNSGTLGFDWADSEVADNITASSYLPLAGGTMAGDIVMGDDLDINFADASAALTFDDTDDSITVGGETKMGGNTISAAAQAITDNALVTVDGTPANTELAVWTAAGLDGVVAATYYAVAGDALAGQMDAADNSIIQLDWTSNETNAAHIAGRANELVQYVKDDRLYYVYAAVTNYLILSP